jgi:O-antigen ligase
MAPVRSAAEGAVFATVTIALITIPLVFSELGQDPFRGPKVLLLRTVAVVILSLLVALQDRAQWRATARNLLSRPDTMLAAGIVGWCAFCTATALHRHHAFESLIDITSGAVFYLGARFAFERRGLAKLDAMMIPALLNAVIYLLEELRIWHPFRLLDSGHPANGALLGNPNDVGAYLLLSALAAASVWRCAVGKRRAAYAFITLFLIAAVAASQTLTAIIALAFGLVAMAVVIFPRRAPIGVLVGLILLAGSLYLFAPARTRVSYAIAHARAGNLNELLSGRVPAFLAAWEMFREHPFHGVGPGGFGPSYFDYRLLADARYPKASHWSPALGKPQNFRQTHNDHLQILAELGLFGYSLFITALFMLSGRSLVRSPRLTSETQHRAIPHVLALPLAVALFVLCIAQFPLQLAASSTAILFLAAICFSPEASST